MTTINAKFVGNIPYIYDTIFGPIAFDHYAKELAKAAAELDPGDVLELAAGTGILSRRLRDEMQDGSRLVVSDLNEDMLDIARSKFTDSEAVEIMSADALNLPFADDEFGQVLCSFGVMFFPDRIASYREVARVLKPKGHYIFNTWSALSENPHAQIAHGAVAHFYPDDTPGFYLPAYGYGDPDDVKRDLSAAGWIDVEHQTLSVSKLIENPAEAANAMINGTPMGGEILQRGGVDPQDVVDLILERWLKEFGADPCTIPMQANQFVCRLS
jgi:SAM-dependent methyltransferase